MLERFQDYGGPAQLVCRGFWQLPTGICTQGSKFGPSETGMYKAAWTEARGTHPGLSSSWLPGVLCLVLIEQTDSAESRGSHNRVSGLWTQPLCVFGMGNEC